MAFDHTYMGDSSNNVFDALEVAKKKGYALTDTWWIDGKAGDDTLSGANGRDYMIGGSGADVMAGRLGDDVYFVDDVGDSVIEKANQGRDLVKSSLYSYTLADNVEDLELTGINLLNQSYGYGNDLNNLMLGHKNSNHSDRLYGRKGNDSMYGYAGNDLLQGDEGNDTLNGGEGNDTLDGGTGDDVYIVDTFLDASTGDVVIESAGGGTDTIYASLGMQAISTTLPGHVENLVLTDMAKTGHGNFLNNKIYGNDQDNILSGRDHDDILRGYEGDDVIYGDGTAGVLIHGDDLIYGGVGDDYLSGNGGDDTLYGGEGDDTLVGGSGSDLLFGDAGADEFHIGAEIGSDYDIIKDYSLGQGDLVRVFNAGYSISYENLLGGSNLDTVIRNGTDLMAVVQDTTNVNVVFG